MTAFGTKPIPGRAGARSFAALPGREPENFSTVFLEALGQEIDPNEFSVRQFEAIKFAMTAVEKARKQRPLSHNDIDIKALDPQTSLKYLGKAKLEVATPTEGSSITGREVTLAFSTNGGQTHYVMDVQAEPLQVALSHAATTEADPTTTRGYVAYAKGLNDMISSIRLDPSAKPFQKAFKVTTGFGIKFGECGSVHRFLGYTAKL